MSARASSTLSEFSVTFKNHLFEESGVTINSTPKRVFFAGGAGNDQIGWKYIERWGARFIAKGYRFIRINASHDDPKTVQIGDKPINDMTFTALHRSSGSVRVMKRDPYDPKGLIYVGNSRVNDSMIDLAVKNVTDDLKNKPPGPTEIVSLAGYSYGSVLMAHVALALGDKGTTIDNLILIGSPIPSSSSLYKELTLIVTVVREDIPGDKFSDPDSIIEFVEGMVQNADDNGPHFDLARPDNPETKSIDEGAIADAKITKAIASIDSKIKKR